MIHTKHIKKMKIEVCSACQNDCRLCLHGDLRKKLKDYQLSLEQVEKFTYYTEKSGYYIDQVRIHGPGEPLLWKYLNEGLALLSKSDVIGSIFISTNGLAIDRIKEDSWNYINKMRINAYGNLKQTDTLKYLIKKYSHIITYKEYKCFHEIAASLHQSASIPCECSCKGPMLLGNDVFLFCGPPVFGSAAIQGIDIYDYPEIYNRVCLNYLDRYNESLIGNIEFCRHCQANKNIKREKKKHDFRGGTGSGGIF
jgi:hypothetical protein